MQVPKRVYEGLLAVRTSGFTNMLIIHDVIHCARKMGYPETARWVEDNREQYWEGIFQGFSPSA